MQSTVKAETTFIETYLEGGMRLLLIPRHFAPLVSLQLWVNVGSMDEGPGEEGIAHVLEHMLFKGSENFPGPGQAAHLVESAGGDINAYTSFEETVYYFNAPKEFLPVGTKLLLDMVLRAKIDSDELVRELEVVQEEIRQGKDNPSRIVSQNLFKTFYNGTARARPVIGYVETVAVFDAPKVRGFYEKWYRSNNMTFVIAGDFDPAELKALLDLEAQKFQPGSLPPRELRSAQVSQRREDGALSLVQGPFQDLRFVLSTRAPCLETEQSIAWDVFSSILAHGDSSRLSRSVRDDEQLVLAVDADTYSPKQPFGMWSLSFYAKVENAKLALSRCLDEVVSLATHGPEPEEIQRVIQSVKAERVYALESIEGIARNAGWCLGTKARLEYENVYLKKLEQVSPEDVKKVARGICSAIGKDDYGISSASTKEVPVPWSSEELKIFLGRWHRGHFGGLVGAGPEGDTQTAEPISETGLSVHRTVSPRDPQVHQWQIGDKVHFNWKHVKRLPLVSGCFVVQGGGLLDTKETAGLRQLVAQMLTRGNRKQSYKTFVNELENRSASISAYVSKDLFGIRFDCLKEHGDRVLEMMFDCLFRPAFDPEELHRQISENKDVLVSQKDSPGVRMSRVVSPLLYPGHSYGLPLLGTDANLTGFSREGVLGAWKELLSTPKKFVLSVAGDFDEKKFFNKIEHEFKGHLDGLTPSVELTFQEPKSLTLSDVRHGFDELEREQTHVQLALRAYPLSDKRRTALEIMTQILGGQGGRLFLDLRDKRSLAYSVGASQSPHLFGGNCTLYISTAASKTQEALGGLKEHLERIASELASPQELDRAKAALLGGQAQSSQHLQTHATRLAMSDVYGNPFDHFLGFEERVRAVTLEDVRESIANLLQTHPPLVGLVGPASTPKNQESLAWKSLDRESL